MNLLVFGSGKTYQENKIFISKDDKIVGFLDNNLELFGKQMDGVLIYNPNDISKLSYDKIILMSIYAFEMYNQLLELGCKKEDIIHYKEYIGKQASGEMKILFPEKKQINLRERGLIITTVLGFNGGSIAAVNAAIALRNCGYEIVIAAPNSNPLFLQEVRKKEITVVLYNNLMFANEKELNCLDKFKFIIVNTLQMSCCAIEIAKKRKVILWLHEALNFYEEMNYWEEKIKKEIASKQLKVYAVSSNAKNNFIKNYPGKKVDILPYGIPQEYCVYKREKKKNFVFAVIGYVNEQKGQDVFLDAIEKIEHYPIYIEFWIIGKMPNNHYVEQIRRRVKNKAYIKLFGEVTHDEIIRLYNEIDVLVVASREDMLPMVATEAMMFEKTCIVSDAAGTVNYIEEYVNGLLFSKENSDELAEKMLWCIENKNRLEGIGIQARKTYEQNFSMKVFESNLERIIKEKT